MKIKSFCSELHNCLRKRILIDITMNLNQSCGFTPYSRSGSGSGFDFSRLPDLAGRQDLKNCFYIFPQK